MVFRNEIVSLSSKSDWNIVYPCIGKGYTRKKSTETRKLFMSIQLFESFVHQLDYINMNK